MAKVVIDRSLLTNFVARAKRRYPKEYIEALWGTIDGATVYIHALYPVDHKGTPRRCSLPDDWLEQQKQMAEEENLIMLGSLHTHPDCYPVPSSDDLVDALGSGETIMGICELSNKNDRFSSKVSFWPCMAPLKVEYK